jgi:hypothetical protein
MNGWLLASFIVFGTSIPAQDGRAPQRSKNTWHQDYVAARQFAAQTGKPMMVVFRCEP